MAVPWVGIRIWIGGQLVVDEKLNALYDHEAGGAPARAMAAVHQDLVTAAAKAGKVWLVEVTDPDGSFEPLCFGTDGVGMVAPEYVDGPEDWSARVEAHFSWPETN